MGLSTTAKRAAPPTGAAVTVVTSVVDDRRALVKDSLSIRIQRLSVAAVGRG